MSPQTIANYVKRAAQGEEPFAQFALDMDAARAAYVCRTLAAIDTAGTGGAPGDKRGDHRALCWRLEKLDPQCFGTKNEVIVENRTRAIGDPSPEEAAAIVRRIFGDHGRPPLIEE